MEAWRLVVGDSFLWNDCVYTVTGWDRDKSDRLLYVLVRRVMFKMDGRWIAYKTSDEESFNPYCDVVRCELQPVAI